MSDRLWFIVPAAGKGDRAGLRVPKQFALVGDKTILEMTLSRLLEIPEVEGVVVPFPAGFSEIAGKIRGMGSPRRPVVVVRGGATRQESVRCGLGEVPSGAEWVGVHDASRPHFSADLVYRVWSAAKACGAAIPGIKPRDTMKRVRLSGSGSALFAAETFGRDALISAQTPQIFRTGILRLAHRRALAIGAFSTDDSGLVEAVGRPVSVVEGERANVKLTYPEDFEPFSAPTVSLACEGRAPAGAAVEDPRLPGVAQVDWGVTGFGFDVHSLEAGRKCVLGGVQIESLAGPVGHSDGDVLSHAIMDAILGGMSKGDIGVWFPPGDPLYEGASSLGLMKILWQALRSEARVLHVDATVVAEAPKISAYYAQIRTNIAQVLEIGQEAVSVKATTAEKLGFLGRGEGIAAFAVVTLLRRLSVSEP